MSGALLYLVARTTVNGLRFRLSRLRNPRYLVPTLVGLAYFSWLFLGSGMRRHDEGEPFAFPAAAAMGAVLLFLGLTWYSALKRPGLTFTLPEVHLLFPAPLSRRDLIRYRWLRAQPAMFLGMLFATIFLGRMRGGTGFLYAGAGAFLLFNLIFLHQTAASLTLARIREKGGTAWIPLVLFLLFVGAVAAAAGISIRDAWLTEGLPDDLWPWLERTLTAGLAGWVLWPLQCCALLPLSDSPALFGLRAVVVLGVLALHYIWVTSSRASFEEASAVQAQRMAQRIQAWRRGRLDLSDPDTRRPPRRALVPLAAAGPAWLAVAWKGLVAQTRQTSLVFLGVLTVLLFTTIASLGIFVGGRGDEGGFPGLVLVAGILGGVAVLLVFMGPSLLREDLRTDLSNLAVLKSLPISGSDLVRGEVAGVALPAVAVQTGLLAGSAVCVALAGQEELALPAVAVLFAGGAALLAALTVAGFVVMNATAVLLPAWVTPGRESAGPGDRGGIETMGRGIVTTLGRMLALMVLLVPAGGVFAALFIPGLLLLGIWAFPVAALATTAALLAESELLIRWLGTRLERLDVSEEGL